MRLKDKQFGHGTYCWLLSFRHLSVSLFFFFFFFFGVCVCVCVCVFLFLLGALHKRSKFANFCYDLMKNYFRNYLYTQKKTLSLGFETKLECFHFFSIVKMLKMVLKSVG